MKWIDPMSAEARVKCRHCGKPAGWQCVTKSGNPAAVHKIRQADFMRRRGWEKP